jgi:hypothetical protein
MAQETIETLFLVGSGAVEKAWMPVIRALKKSQAVGGAGYGHSLADLPPITGQLIA